MFIFQIDASKILQAQNIANSNHNDTPESTLLKSLSKATTKPDVCLGCGPEPGPFPPGGSVPPNTEIPPAMLFGKIMDLATEYIIYAQTHQNTYR